MTTTTRQRREFAELWTHGRQPGHEFAGHGAALYRGDAVRLLDRLNDGAFDCVATDPPYSSGGANVTQRRADPVVKYCTRSDAKGRASFTGDHLDQRSWAWWCAGWLQSCRRVTRIGGYLLVFTDWRQLPALSDAVQAAGWTWRGVIPWNKGRGSRAPHKGYFRHQCEYVLWGTNGPCPIADHGGPFEGCVEHSICAQRAAGD